MLTDVRYWELWHCRAAYTNNQSRVSAPSSSHHHAQIRTDSKLNNVTIREMAFEEDYLVCPGATLPYSWKDTYSGSACTVCEHQGMKTQSATLHPVHQHPHTPTHTHTPKHTHNTHAANGFMRFCPQSVHVGHSQTAVALAKDQPKAEGPTPLSPLHW